MQRVGKRFVSLLIIIAMLPAMLSAQALAAEQKLNTSDEIFSESAPIEALTVASQPSFSFTTISGYTYMIRYYKSGYEITPDNIQATALSGGTAVETATAVPLDISDLVCNAGDKSNSSETALSNLNGSSDGIIISISRGKQT